ncbi:MAG: translation initiation factor, partial [Candidatus Woesearchaeota archaeon]|nr:translation initiation factor [Candidatus Woesearchaeota archaeon]
MKSKNDRNDNNQDSGSFFRVRLPSGKQVLGILESRLGGSRSRVICSDGKVRICRIPGRLKRELWVRPGDIL